MLVLVSVADTDWFRGSFWLFQESCALSCVLAGSGGVCSGYRLVPHNYPQLREGDFQHSQLRIFSQRCVEHYTEGAAVAIFRIFG